MLSARINSHISREWGPLHPVLSIHQICPGIFGGIWCCVRETLLVGTIPPEIKEAIGAVVGEGVEGERQYEKLNKSKSGPKSPRIIDKKDLVKSEEEDQGRGVVEEELQTTHSRSRSVVDRVRNDPQPISKNTSFGSPPVPVLSSIPSPSSSPRSPKKVRTRTPPSNEGTELSLILEGTSLSLSSITCWSRDVISLSPSEPPFPPSLEQEFISTVIVNCYLTRIASLCVGSSRNLFPEWSGWGAGGVIPVVKFVLGKRDDKQRVPGESLDAFLGISTAYEEVLKKRGFFALSFSFFFFLSAYFLPIGYRWEEDERVLKWTRGSARLTTAFCRLLLETRREISSFASPYLIHFVEDSLAQVFSKFLFFFLFFSFFSLKIIYFVKFGEEEDDDQRREEWVAAHLDLFEKYRDIKKDCFDMILCKVPLFLLWIFEMFFSVSEKKKKIDCIDRWMLSSHISKEG